jgi:hypothetical protein
MPFTWPCSYARRKAELRPRGESSESRKVDSRRILNAPEKRAGAEMIPIVFSILVLVALLSVCSSIFIRVRLTKAEPSRDKLVWWRRSSDEVGRMYEQLFPGSYLPRVIETGFWIVLVAALLVLSIVFRHG